ANQIASRSRVDRDVAGPLPSTDAAEALSQVAHSFAVTGAKIGHMADKATAKEGEEAGRIAGLDPEFRPTRSLTIRGEAYDQAGLQVAGARLRQTLEADLDNEFARLQGNP